MTLRKMALAILLTISINALAQTDNEDNIIDQSLQKCLDSDEGQTTSGMINCTIAARDAWDIELNKYYTLLMKMLSTEEKKKLKIAQKKWLLYRDTEFEFSSTVYHNLEGTMSGIFVANRFMEIVKTRALELKEYYDILPNEK